MKCLPTTVELEVVVSRIRNHTINLQPDYQRGEVWTVAKKKKLIDTIIRGWMIPPIHLISDENAIVEEVLDGQQRLVAIRDFFEGKFSIDGSIHPLSEDVSQLDGKYFEDLPAEVKFRIERYSITFIKLSDYLPEEPAELFNRLNQPATLTAAEKRNAYIGKTRKQIKDLVNDFEKKGASKELIGFSNSRLAYDEVISKFAFMLEANTLKKKITAGDIAKRYQEDIVFTDDTILNVSLTIDRFVSSMKILSKNELHAKLSKATIISWWIFAYKNEVLPDIEIADVISGFEAARDFLKNKQRSIDSRIYETKIEQLQDEYPFFEAMVNIYNQRASMGSTDALSIIYRDIIIHLYAEMVEILNIGLLSRATMEYSRTKNINAVLEIINDELDWGRIIK